MAERMDCLRAAPMASQTAPWWECSMAALSVSPKADQMGAPWAVKTGSKWAGSWVALPEPTMVGPWAGSWVTSTVAQKGFRWAGPLATVTVVR